MTDHERLGPPPIEPLSDVSWSRVERGVWARLDAETPTRSMPPSPRRWWLVAAPLAAAAAIAMIVLATRGQTLQVADETSRVVTGTAPSQVSFGDSHIELEAATALVMTHEADHPTVLLDRGAAWFTVAPRLARPAFIVRAGDATVRVVGTRFRVGRSEERIAVEVDRGVVDVQFRGSVVPLRAGQRWSSDAPGYTAAVAALPPPAEPVATEPEPEVVAPEPEPEVAPPAPRHEPKPARPAPSTVRTEPKLGSAHAGATEGDRDPDRDEYDRLAALEPKSPEVALVGYLALARGTSRWADPALFAGARLAVDRHDRRAETLLGIYLQRFPGGANAADARKLLARLRSTTP
jgi:hypothetical protein